MPVGGGAGHGLRLRPTMLPVCNKTKQAKGIANNIFKTKSMRTGIVRTGVKTG